MRSTLLPEPMLKERKKGFIAELVQNPECRTNRRVIRMSFNPALNPLLNLVKWCPFEDFCVRFWNDVGLEVLDTIDGNHLGKREETLLNHL